MKYIIDKINETLLRLSQEYTTLTNEIIAADLSENGIEASANYPIAIIHQQEKLDERSQTQLEEFSLFKNDGHTQTTQELQTLQKLHPIVPNVLQTASIALINNHMQTLHFASKYPKDYWKKITEVSHIDAIVEFTACDEDICICEGALREIIRKRKEVNALKAIGFIWILHTKESKDYSLLLSHYFGDNFAMVESEDSTCYVGWSNTLKEVNMRYFVCPPSP